MIFKVEGGDDQDTTLLQIFQNKLALSTVKGKKWSTDFFYLGKSQSQNELDSDFKA